MRRSNKSNKVPNVKLRPAQRRPAAVQNDPFQVDQSSDTEFAPNASMQDLCPRPLRGITICATGIVDKSTLFKQAFELGALSTSDFTDRVTHLVASEHGGAKYMCALERKIPIVRPEWIHDAYEVWLRGDDVEFEQSLQKYRLPVFSGIVLSLSGIDDAPRRTQVNQLLTQQGGVYLKNLERPVKVTHLLCSGDNETEKMKYAVKFNKKGEANIHLVWEEWFWDSLEFGGRFDERKYQVSRPRPERKSLVAPEVVKPVDLPAKKLPQGAEDATADEEEEETGLLKCVPAVTLQLWESLLKPRGFEVSEGKLVRSPSKSHANIGSSKELPVKPRAQEPHAGGSVISSLKRTNSFAPVVKETSARLFRRTATHAAFSRVNGPENAEGSGLATSNNLPRPLDAPQDDRGTSMIAEANSSMKRLFYGSRFRLLGEARSPRVRNAIEQCGGTLVSEEDLDNVDFIIVRLISGSKIYQMEADKQERCKYRTECWLEHCIFKESICHPEENITFVPLNVKTPIPEAELIRLSISGLDQAQLCWIGRLLRALGINLMPNFSNRSTHLLCPSGTGLKTERAREWSIPVISLDWLVHIASHGVVPDPYLYVVGLADTEDTVDMQTRKDKGKDKALDVHMSDVTNNAVPKLPLFAKKPNLLEDQRNDEESLSLVDFEPAAAPEDLFGKPNGFLGSPRDGCLSSPPAPPQSSSPPSEPPDMQAQQLNRPLDRISRMPTQVSMDVDAEARIPSSNSPSPMKLPPSSNPFDSSPGRHSDVRAASPTKFQSQVTRALQESLTTLLGKRHISEEDVTAPPGRGKRARPQSRAKQQPRQGPTDIIQPADLLRNEPLFDVGSYDEIDILDREGQRAEQSLRVTYEDPEQRLVQQHLMSLLGDQPGGQGSSGKDAEGPNAKGRGLKRRGTRVAGF